MYYTLVQGIAKISHYEDVIGVALPSLCWLHFRCNPVIPAQKLLTHLQGIEVDYWDS